MHLIALLVLAVDIFTLASPTHEQSFVLAPKLLKGGGGSSGGGGGGGGGSKSSSPSPSGSSGSKSSSPPPSRSPFAPSSSSRTYSRPRASSDNAPSPSPRVYATSTSAVAGNVLWSNNARAPYYFGAGNVRPWWILPAAVASTCALDYYSYAGLCR